MDTSPASRLRQRYARWVERRYERLPALAREDAVRLDAWLSSTTGLGVLAGLVVLAGLLAWALVAGRPDKSWWPVFGLMLLLVFCLTFAGLSMWFAHGRKSARPARIVVLTSLGALAGGYLGYLGSGLWDQGLDLARLEAAVTRVTPIVAPIGLGLAGALALVSVLRNREYAARARVGEAQATAERAQRLASEAELRALQAQIEPHFLFNTLSAAQYLAEAGDPRAATLLAELNGLLRNTLDATRGTDASVADEAQRVRHYLAICAIRLGPRLQWRVSIEADAADARLPAASLLTLVENAIEHGIEPALAGGRVEVNARVESHRVLIEVRNTGEPPRPQAHPGIGLANLRERLRLLAGPSAELALERRGPETVASIHIDRPDPDAQSS